MTCQMRKELKRRSAVEPVIGHMKKGDKLGRNDRLGELDDKINVPCALWRRAQYPPGPQGAGRKSAAPCCRIAFGSLVLLRWAEERYPGCCSGEMKQGFFKDNEPLLGNMSYFIDLSTK